MKVIITCEHGGNKIPEEYRHLFKDDIGVLKTHKAYDPGALELAEEISKKGDYLFFSETSRLLVELNRSIYNHNLFSSFSKNLNLDKRKEILDNFYFPFRNKVEVLIQELAKKREKSMHISVHTFTPVLNNQVRNADIGILYDPKRSKEKHLAILIRNELLSNDKDLRVRFNYPYLGISDGFTSYLRKKFAQKFYLGLELEVNQKFVLNNKSKWKILKQNLSMTLDSVLK